MQYFIVEDTASKAKFLLLGELNIKEYKFKNINFEQLSNIKSIDSTFKVLNFDKSKYVNFIL